MTEPVPEIPALPDYCWPVNVSCCGDGWDDYPVAVRDRAVALATQTLWVLTAGQVGGCPITVRPCKKDCMDPVTWRTFPELGGNTAATGPFAPSINASGFWINSACGCGPRDCSCTELCEVILPAPVGRISKVTLDGVTLDPSEYRVDDGNKLVRVAGQGIAIERIHVRVTATPDGPLNVNDRVRINPTPSSWTGAVLYPGNFFGWDGVTLGGMTFAVQPGAFQSIEWGLDAASDGFVFEIRDQDQTQFTWLTTPADVLAPGEEVTSSQTPGGTSLVIEGLTGLSAKLFSPTSWETGAGNDVAAGSVALALTGLQTTVGCWPICQDMTLPLTEAGTFGVTYLNAWPVDGLGAYAAGVLACEYAKACSGQKCALPANVTTVSRLGVTLELTEGTFPGGLTGIRQVDTWVRRWNPYALVTPPRVWYPGIRKPRITTWDN